ncbi:MAG: DUF3348 family protein [Cellvibrionaceae bacterium]
MSKPTGHNSPKSSRLLRQLGDFGVLKNQPAENQFGARLGRLIDLSDSISLADTLRQLSKAASSGQVPPAQKQGEKLKAEFLELRSAMVAFIVGSFSRRGAANDDDSSLTSFILPDCTDEIFADDGFKPYQRFYALHQSEMEHQITGFLAAAKTQISAASPKLERVVILDSALFDTLQGYCRKQLAQVSSLLNRRFEALRAAAIEEAGDELTAESLEQWLAPAGWLSRFYREMQNLLLAELDLRLQPLLGLIEACEYEELNQQ